MPGGHDALLHINVLPEGFRFPVVIVSLNSPYAEEGMTKKIIDDVVFLFLCAASIRICGDKGVRQ